jgi:hypothetical protein
MGLSNLTDGKVEEKVTVTLGGKEYLLRFPVRAFRELQEQFGGWVKAWNKMGNQGDDSPMAGEINYEVLAEMLVIAIHQEGIDKSKVSTWLNDLYQDEVVVIIQGMLRARNRFAPEAENKLQSVVTSLTEAQQQLILLKRDTDAEYVGEILTALKEEVEDSLDDPRKQTA